MGHARSELHRAVELLCGASFTVAMTGAGVSAGSGISTFRAEDGIWARFPVEEYGTAAAFRRDPEKVWRLFGSLDGELRDARPNPAHTALAALEKLGLLGGLVTQNIDGLHQAAGSREVVELHGTVATGHCPGCRRTYRREDVAPWPPAPRCSSCDAVLRPDIVLFDDIIPEQAFSRAAKLFRKADAVLAVGTGLEVAPASWLVMGAPAYGATVVVVDPHPSAKARAVATVVVAAAAEEALPALVEIARGINCPVTARAEEPHAGRGLKPVRGDLEEGSPR